MRDFFQVDRPVFEASAPGRLDVMGGVADYSGSLVLQMPIAEKTTVRIQLTGEAFFTVVSEMEGGQKSALVFVDEVLRWGERVRVNPNIRTQAGGEVLEKNEGSEGELRVRVNPNSQPDAGGEVPEKNEGAEGELRVRVNPNSRPGAGAELPEKIEGAEGDLRVRVNPNSRPDAGGEVPEKNEGAEGDGRVRVNPNSRPEAGAELPEKIEGAEGDERVRVNPNSRPEAGGESPEKNEGAEGDLRVRVNPNSRPGSGGEVLEKNEGAEGELRVRVNPNSRPEAGAEVLEKNQGAEGELRVRVNPNSPPNSTTPDSENSWTRYILGCFLFASKQFAFPLQGARVYVTSNVPIGAGLSSSAALEVATLRALSIAYDLNFDTLQLPKLAQRVENEIVGAPCGLMDQLASHHGKPGQLLPIICQPAKLHASIALPADLVLERIPSGVEHQVGGDAYTTARTAAFMGYGILAQRQGVSASQLQAAHESGEWTGLPFQGYLANLDAKEFEVNLESTLPATMLGADFLRQGFVSIDQATTIDPKRVYPVQAATAHPVYENACVQQFASLLAQVDQIDLPRHQIFARLGLLMLSSHASYSAIGLGHEATDTIVHDVVAKGAKRGFYGARVTGGGCGGTVVVLRKRT